MSRRHSPRVTRFLASERAPRLALVLGLALSLPCLGVGLLNDDLIFRVALDGAVPGFHPAAHEIYDFNGVATPAALRDAGAFPWWSSPELSLRFFRPLSSLLFSLDPVLFGDAQVPAHLHSLLWFALLTVLFIGLARRVVRPVAASVSTLVFVVAGAHATTLSWVAARHTLLGATFAAGCVLAHVAWRQEGRRRDAIAAPIALVLGLLARSATAWSRARSWRR